MNLISKSFSIAIIATLSMADNYILSEKTCLNPTPLPIASELVNAPAIINNVSSSLASQLITNRDFINLKKTIAISSFVELDSLKETRGVGNYLSENLMHELQVRGAKIVDYKVKDNISIGANGDFAITRDVRKLNQSIAVDYFIVGTFSSYIQGHIVNVRIIEADTQNVVSSAQQFIPREALSEIIYKKQKEQSSSSTKKIAVGSSNQDGEGFLVFKDNINQSVYKENLKSSSKGEEILLSAK